MTSGRGHIALFSTSGTRSPQAWLINPDDADTLCLFDPADCHPPRLTPGQRCLLARAACACLAVAPAALTESALDGLPPRVPAGWLVAARVRGLAGLSRWVGGPP